MSLLLLCHSILSLDHTIFYLFLLFVHIFRLCILEIGVEYSDEKGLFGEITANYLYREKSKNSLLKIKVKKYSSTIMDGEIEINSYIFELLN